MDNSKFTTQEVQEELELCLYRSENWCQDNRCWGFESRSSRLFWLSEARDCQKELRKRGALK